MNIETIKSIIADIIYNDELEDKEKIDMLGILALIIMKIRQYE